MIEYGNRNTAENDRNDCHRDLHASGGRHHEVLVEFTVGVYASVDQPFNLQAPVSSETSRTHGERQARDVEHVELRDRIYAHGHPECDASLHIARRAPVLVAALAVFFEAQAYCGCDVEAEWHACTAPLFLEAGLDIVDVAH